MSKNNFVAGLFYLYYVKKIVAIFFLFIYGFTTVGATVHQHFCMGEYIGSNIYHTQKKECGKCGMKTAKSKDCCQDKHQFIQLKREHNQASVAIDAPKFFSETLVPYFSIYNASPVFYPCGEKSFVNV